MFQVADGHVPIPTPLSPPLVPGDDVEFDPHGMALAVMGGVGTLREGGPLPVDVVRHMERAHHLVNQHEP
ncbi:unnamed protein product [Allacma fusca]|uniref:Uncharacterized protein n=1 Tax=Allacma fusca TaxID=39272 RepID=A0A8J2K2E6_9HEXA|nr:unnamed protein product [Allacma fusca]